MFNGIRLSNTSSGIAWLTDIEKPGSMWSVVSQTKKLYKPLEMAYIQTKQIPARVLLEMVAQW